MYRALYRSMYSPMYRRTRKSFPQRNGNRKLKTRSSGLYLVRSGGTYLFQIRLPKRIGGGAGSRPIRVSLGSLPHQQARELANALGALAPTLFREIEKRMAGKQGANSKTAKDLGDEGSLTRTGLSILPVCFLKAALFDIQKPARAPTPAEAECLEMMRGLVRIGREVSAKQSGKPHDAMIADNAELLASRHVAKYQAAAGPVLIPEQLYSSVSVPTSTVPSQPPGLPLSEPAQMTQLEAEQGQKGNRLISANVKAAFQLDRRTVERPASSKPLFSVVANEYLATRKSSKSGEKRISPPRKLD